MSFLGPAKFWRLRLQISKKCHFDRSVESHNVKNWRGPQRLPSHTVLNFFVGHKPIWCYGKSCTSSSQKENKIYSCTMNFIHNFRGFTDTSKFIQRSLRPAPSIFRWTNRTREDKSLAQGHVLSVFKLLSIHYTPYHQVRLCTSAVPLHSRAIPQCSEMGFWMLWQNCCWPHPSSQVRVCGPSNLGSHTTAFSSPGYPIVFWWLSVWQTLATGSTFIVRVVQVHSK